MVEGVGRPTEVEFVANSVTEGGRGSYYAMDTVKGHGKHSKICVEKSCFNNLYTCHIVTLKVQV